MAGIYSVQCAAAPFACLHPGGRARAELLQQDCAPEAASVIAAMYVDLLCVVHALKNLAREPRSSRRQVSHCHQQ